MSTPSTDRVRGALLREWRFSQNWDVTELAQRVNLSIGQIQQLETGGTSLFYSAAIRETAARKVAMALGGDPNAVIRTDEVPPLSSGQETKVVDDLIELSRKKGQPHQGTSFVARHPRLIAFFVVLLVLLIALSGWLQQKWQQGGAQQFWRQTPAKSVVTETVPAASAVPVVIAPPVESASSAMPVSAPAPAPVTTAAVTTEPVTRTATAPAVVPVSAAPVGQALCKPVSSDDPVIVPGRPTKSGDMVYIVAHKEGSICVVDSAGSRTLMSLKEKEARSVYGPAPWRVHFQQAEQAQIYFQGERLRLPDSSITTMALQEAAKSP